MNKQVYVFVALMIIASSLCCAESPTHGMESPSKQAITSAMNGSYDFLQRVEAIDNQQTRVQFLAAVRNDGSGFNPTHGQVIDAHLPSVKFKMSLETQELLSAIFVEQNPRSVSVIDDKGLPVTQDEIRNELVKCTIGEARAAAVGFLKRGLGEDVLEDVELKRGELLFRGSFFVYNFTWREPTDKNGVALRFKWLHVSVNTETCRVADFAQAESNPSLPAAIDAEKARLAVVDAKSELGAIEVTRLGLVELKRLTGAPIPAWAVSYERPSVGLSLNAQEIVKESCYVNAMNGRVFQSTKELLKAATEKARK